MHADVAEEKAQSGTLEIACLLACADQHLHLPAPRSAPETSASNAAATTRVHVSETQKFVMEHSQTTPLKEHSFNNSCRATLDSHRYNLLMSVCRSSLDPNVKATHTSKANQPPDLRLDDSAYQLNNTHNAQHALVSGLTRARPRLDAMSQPTLLVQIVTSAPDSRCVRINCP